MKPRKTVEQAAAIALWKGRVCLVTSRSGKRWVLPKGRLEHGKSHDEIALQEAWEEAGLRGEVRDSPIGTYFYVKAGKVHEVKVFMMEVTKVLDTWPERHRRERCWLRPEKAMSRIREIALRSLLLEVSTSAFIM